jgi:hypothetical protein
MPLILMHTGGVLHCSIDSHRQFPRLRDVEQILQKQAGSFAIEKLN